MSIRAIVGLEDRGRIGPALGRAEAGGVAEMVKPPPSQSPGASTGGRVAGPEVEGRGLTPLAASAGTGVESRGLTP